MFFQIPKNYAQWTHVLNSGMPVTVGVALWVELGYVLSISAPGQQS